MTTYPGAIDEFRTTQNLPGILYNEDDTTTVFAEDTNNHSSAIVAIETTLGVDPAGDFADVASRLEALGRPSYYLSVASFGVQAIPASTTTVVVFNQVVQDDYDQWDPSTYSVTIQEAGLYYFEASMWYNENITTGNNKFEFYRNGVDFLSQNNPQTVAYETRNINRIKYMDVGDNIVVTVAQDSGATRYIDAYPAAVYFSMMRLGNL